MVNFVRGVNFKALSFWVVGGGLRPRSPERPPCGGPGIRPARPGITLPGINLQYGGCFGVPQPPKIEVRLDLYFIHLSNF